MEGGSMPKSIPQIFKTLIDEVVSLKVDIAYLKKTQQEEIYSLKKQYEGRLSKLQKRNGALTSAIDKKCPNHGL